MLLEAIAIAGTFIAVTIFALLIIDILLGSNSISSNDEIGFYENEIIRLERQLKKDPNNLAIRSRLASLQEDNSERRIKSIELYNGALIGSSRYSDRMVSYIDLGVDQFPFSKDNVVFMTLNGATLVEGADYILTKNSILFKFCSGTLIPIDKNDSLSLYYTEA